MKQLLTKTLISCLLTLCILVMTLFAPIVYAEDMTGNEETEALLNTVLSHPDLPDILFLIHLICFQNISGRNVLK